MWSVSKMTSFEGYWSNAIFLQAHFFLNPIKLSHKTSDQILSLISLTNIPQKRMRDEKRKYEGFQPFHCRPIHITESYLIEYFLACYTFIGIKAILDIFTSNNSFLKEYFSCLQCWRLHRVAAWHHI